MVCSSLDSFQVLNTAAWEADFGNRPEGTVCTQRVDHSTFNMASDACCTPAPPAEHIDEGKTGTIGGLPAYLNNPSGSAKAAIIFAPDVFGYDAPLIRKLADKAAAAGFYAVIPDLLKGDPYVPKDPAAPFANVGPWIAIHHPELKEQGVESVGIAGFCWGARVAVMIGKEPDLIKATFLCHPSFTTKENVTDLKVATAILASEIDDFTPPSLVLEFKEILDTKPFPSLVKIFPGQTHGWTIRYDVNDPHLVKGAEEAHEDLLAFAKKVLV
ncbi:unnamed protein product [Calypogeia fissa]